MKKSNLKLQKSKAHGYRFKVGRYLQIAMALVFLVFVGRFLYIGISKTVSGQNLSVRTQQLYRRNQVLKATRGSIYDCNGLEIAEDSHLYTLYAILDKSSINYKNKPEYVVNKRLTAKKLARVLPLSAEKIYDYLNPKKKAFQVQFGTAGSNLSPKEKKQIVAMKLPGIKFTETPSRIYPNGVFASHVVGLAQPQYNKKTKSQDLVGTMGLEAWYNNLLTGTDGYRISSINASQNEASNNKRDYKAPRNGDNLYLTLNSQLESFLEQRLNAVQEKYDPVNLTAVVEDMKTGKVLAAAQRPTFNPQTKKGLTKSYTDSLVQQTFEPGSVFKILTLSAAQNSGRFNPNTYYRSGSVTVGGATIHDWQTSGWGTIPLSQAFMRSSNVGFVHIEQEMGARIWRKYLRRFHIGKKTGVTLPGEQAGLLSFKGPTDQAVTSFGQGVDVNAMQLMQAFSTLGNNGQMVKPQFVDRITNSQGQTIHGYQIKKVGAPVYNKATRKFMIRNMKRVMNREMGTGYAYHMPGKDIAIKTGTAQITNPKGGGYLKGNSNYIFSVVGVTPTNNPRYCIYLSMKQPRRMTEAAEVILASIFKPMMNHIIAMSKNDQTASSTDVQVPNLKGKTITTGRRELTKRGLSMIKLGSGNRVVMQGVRPHDRLESGSKLFVLTKGRLICSQMKGWTLADLHQFAALTGIKLEVNGSGLVAAQSLKAGQKIKSNKKIKVILKE